MKSYPSLLALAGALAFAVGAPTSAQPMQAGSVPGTAPGVPGIQPADAPQEVSVTVYSSADPAGFNPQQFIAQQQMGYDPSFAWQVPGFGVVKEVRQIQFGQGLNTLRLTDVAQFIDPTTVSFTDINAPDATAVLEQQFLFDLVNPSKLLEKYLGQEVTVVLPAANDQYETRTGILLSATQNQIVLQDDGGVDLIPRSDKVQVHLGALPGGLITKPTLEWRVQSNLPGQRPVRTTYQTAGITWRSDYNLIVSGDETEADLGAWVTLMNLSGATYPNAKLKLIAGDVQRIQPQPPQPMYRRDVMMMESGVAGAGFVEQPFFEYHLYTLPRPTTIQQNATQQITLFPTAHDVAVEKVLVYYGLPMAARWGYFPDPRTDRNFGNQSNEKVDVYFRFDNSEDNQLGIPLPAGKMRVYKQDPNDQTLEFVGEDLIDHTPRDEEVLIRVGQSFDVVGERTQTNFTLDTRAHVMTESFRIELRNHKDEPAKVIVKENLYRWSEWQITDAVGDWEKIDARTIHFTVDVPARSEKVVTYTVKYTW